MNLRLAIPLVVVLLSALLSRLPREQATTSHSDPPLFSVSATVPHPVSSSRPLDDDETIAVAEQMTALTQALYHGSPIRLSAGENDNPHTYLFRPRRATTEQFVFSLGLDGSTVDTVPHVFEGIRTTGPGRTSDRASLVVVGESVAAVVRQTDGTTLYVRTDPATGNLQARREQFVTLDSKCSIDPISGLSTMRSDDPLKSDEELWREAEVASIEVAALTGIDPASGELDKYINPIKRATAYDASLKDALMLLVLDKETTGSGSITNLTSKASLYLATVSNVAAAYENQLGIRLLVSEMIMIPDENNFFDIPHGEAITDFRDWIVNNRRNATFQWSMAAKFGDGLDGVTLGIAFTRAIGSNSATSVMRPTAVWDVLAHEMAHNLGSEHSQGGLMNATSTNGNSRSFFTDVSPGETSAKEIYDYARALLEGSALMRHPEQIPFAEPDYRSTPVNQTVEFSPLDNDRESVQNGATNALALEEVSAVTPLAAGTAVIVGEELVFTPAQDFAGTAWFSYTVRGSVGNGGSGWLHKGDVAIDVGQFAESTTLTLAPGASYSFIPSSTNGLTQPSQALVSRSRDDRDLLIIRVNADAAGTDTFRSGARTYTLNYTDRSPLVTNDRYVYDPADGRLRFNPLVNDEGAGQQWVNPIKPTIGVGTSGHDSSGNELFPTTFRMSGAQNLTPEKGTLTTSVLPFVVGGSRDNRLDSTLTFTPSLGATGIATIEYTVVDAAGVEATGIAEIVLPFRTDRLVNTGDVCRYHIPGDDADDTSWMLPEFDDTGWTQAITGIGYDNSSDFLPEIASTLTNLGGVNTSVYVRLPFNVSAPDQYDQISLRMKVDDGFVAYLNGTEVARSSNAPSGMPLPWNAQATVSNSDAQALQFVTFDLSSYGDQLRGGENILALHGLNSSLTSSDFLLVPEMDGVVTSSSVQVISPAVDAIRLPAGTGLLLEGKTGGAVAGGNVSWAQVSGPAGGVTFESSDALQAAALFGVAGVYKIQFTAVAGTQSLSTTIEVTVPGNDESIPKGAEVIAGVDQEIAGLVASLNGYVSPGGFDQLSWQQVAGSGTVVFSAPNALATEAGFPSAGSYHLRLVAEREGIRTFDDVVLTLGGDPSSVGLAALVQPVTEVDSSSARLQSSAFFSGDTAAATYFVGLQDAGQVAASWERMLSVGSQSPGDIAARVDDLLFETLYVYRLRLERGEEVAWSDLGTFTTNAALQLSETLVEEGAAARVFVPTDGSVDGIWRQPAFDDGSWIDGATGIGYDLDVEFDPWILTDIEAEMFEQGTSVYIRVPFEVTAHGGVVSLTLRMRYDDAFIAYLNGQEIVRSATAPQAGESGWETAAAIRREDTQAIVFEEFDLSHHRDLLVDGINVLAIQGLNNIPENRDLLLSPELEATRSQTYYQHWLTNYPNLPADERDLRANPDGDDFDNMQEYVFGGDPTQVDAVADLMPSVALSAEGQLTYHFRRRFNLEARGISLVLQSSQDLSAWISLGLEEAQVSRLMSGIEAVVVPLSATEDALRFWRLRAVID